MDPLLRQSQPPPTTPTKLASINSYFNVLQAANYYNYKTALYLYEYPHWHLHTFCDFLIKIVDGDFFKLQ